MSDSTENGLSQGLVELFDMKKAKLRNEERLTQEAAEALKDIRLLTLMFRDGIPDIDVQMSEKESIRWDARAQKLVYIKDNTIAIVEATSQETRIRIRPFLGEMVKKAKKFYV